MYAERNHDTYMTPREILNLQSLVLEFLEGVVCLFFYTFSAPINFAHPFVMAVFLSTVLY